MSARNADLSIEVEVSRTGSRLIFGDTQVAGLPFRGPLYRGIREQRITLNRDLRRIVTETGARITSSRGWASRIFQRFGFVQSDQQHWAKVTRAVKQLYERGQALTEDLFGDESAEAEKILRRVCPLWRTPDPTRIDRLPLIDVLGNLADTVPIEYLPLLDTGAIPPQRIDNIAQLTDALRPFIGFSSVVRRTDPDIPQSQVDELPNLRTLPIKFFRNPTLRYTGKELANLEAKHRVSVDKWRNAAAMRRENFPCYVARHIWIHDGERFDGSMSESPFQVLHFACHCNTGGSSDDHKLIFGDESDPNTQVRISQLKQCRRQHYADIQPFQHAAHPFVFLNACGSSVIDPGAVTSLPDIFLKNGSCAYIGTEARVPDELAELFSDAFYSEFLSGASIGTALYRAKWNMLQIHNNPLGLLYMMYGNPDVTLQRPLAFTPVLPSDSRGDG